ncbi:MAG: electron transfer flavoprotein beta subunit/FixA family protein [Actinobacteria bacterium]|nr:electron transfer flavoprotein beta subunit/FixA family protein [Actinomycetota bacterium]
MNILVCVKRVPAPGARINITSDGQQVDTAFLGFTVSPHEECAVEQAVQLIEKHGGDVTVLTLGPAEAEEQLRTAVSTGATKAVLVPIDTTDWDPQRTAQAIAKVIVELETKNGKFDLVLFGNESADSCGYQVGRRESDAGVEIYKLKMPACVGIKEGINLPRYPTMKGRLASKKVAVDRSEASGETGGLKLITLRRPPERASNTVILGNGPEAAPAVVDLLEELGVFK